jgi:hypothetical protein
MSIKPKKYLQRSWIDPRIVIKSSPIDGNGMFATSLIRRGQKLLIWGGDLFSSEDIIAGLTIENSAVPIDESIYIATKINSEKDDAIYTNHSCSPNIWMKDEVTFIAMTDIHPGEEITPDYCMWENNPNFESRWRCNCGAINCRQIITGLDWTLDNLQTNYEGHFSPFINNRITKLRKASMLK